MPDFNPSLDVGTREDFIQDRVEMFLPYLREQFAGYLGSFLKRGPDGGFIPIGANALTERQEFIMLRELQGQARLVESGGMQPTPAVQAYMQDPEAQARLMELALQFVDKAADDGRARRRDV